MSGVYIYEISPRESSENIIKIGSTRHSLEKRIEDSFNCKFNRDYFSYYMIDLIPANYSLAINLENYLINKLIETHNPERKGREWFYCTRSDIKDFLNNVNQYVIDFYKIGNSMHSSIDLSIGSIIRSKRKIRHMSQSELGEYCGIRQATISEIENGKIGNYSTLKKICDGLDINITFVG